MDDILFDDVTYVFIFFYSFWIFFHQNFFCILEDNKYGNYLSLKVNRPHFYEYFDDIKSDIPAQEGYEIKSKSKIEKINENKKKNQNKNINSNNNGDYYGAKMYYPKNDHEIYTCWFIIDNKYK